MRYELRMEQNLIHTFENRLRTDANVNLLNYVFIDNAGILLCDAFLNRFPLAWYIREPELMKCIWCSHYQNYAHYEMESLVKILDLQHFVYIFPEQIEVIFCSDISHDIL